MPQRPEYHVNLTVMLLVALADGEPRHAYRLCDELIDLAGWRPSASSVNDVLARLHRDGFIEPVPARGRQKPYQLTEQGREELNWAAALLHRLARLGRGRIQQWREDTGSTGDIPARRRPRVGADVTRDLAALVTEKAEAADLPKSAVLREALVQQLVLPAQKNARQPVERATCTQCGRSQRLTRDGQRFYRHIDPRTGEPCTGEPVALDTVPGKTAKRESRRVGAPSGATR
ncbi:PadR family transcriptional regulator [Krasilnikovia sp. MM14-A1259]|uniref:PadR family transcriptional regulator n=1 Tax=Krasilnikovia sp. MM14-A1259 TaxID=3373539 RepID=UPI00380A1C84